MESVTQLSFIAGILAYGLLLSLYIPKKYHFAANASAAVFAVLVGILKGLSFDQLGLGIHVVGKGIIVALAVSIFIMMAVFIVAIIPPLKRYFVHAQHSEPNKVAYETAVRIPLSTALTEEVLFRGVLLGLLLTYHSTIVSIAICSIVFGLWHILPSVEMLRTHSGGTHRLSPKSFVYIVSTICTTAIAGVFFSWLRILAGSIVAPWLTHWSINSSAMLATEFIIRRHSTHPSSKT